MACKCSCARRLGLILPQPALPRLGYHTSARREAECACPPRGHGHPKIFRIQNPFVYRLRDGLKVGWLRISSAGRPVRRFGGASGCGGSGRVSGGF